MTDERAKADRLAHLRSIVAEARNDFTYARARLHDLEKTLVLAELGVMPPAPTGGDPHG